MAYTDVVSRMDLLITDWDRLADRRCDFLRTYRLMTENMLLAIEAGEFHDGVWVRGLLEHFADYYFKALGDFDENRPETPVVWSTTHQAAVQPDIQVLQNLLLGINAHINYDLVLTLYDILSPVWQHLTTEDRRKRYEDHKQVNRVIGRTVDKVQDSILEPKMPVMNLIDRMLGPIDEWTASLLIRTWREEVWDNALRMLDSDEELDREAVRRQVEELTLERARLIIRPAGLEFFSKIF